jgi:hypothetical protein
MHHKILDVLEEMGDVEFLQARSIDCHSTPKPKDVLR